MYNTNRKNTPVYGTVCLIVQKRNQKETKERIYMSCIHPMVHLVQKWGRENVLRKILMIIGEAMPELKLFLINLIYNLSVAYWVADYPQRYLFLPTHIVSILYQNCNLFLTSFTLFSIKDYTEIIICISAVSNINSSRK